MAFILLLILLVIIGGFIILDHRACRQIWLLEQQCNQGERIEARLNDIRSTATGINFDTSELRLWKEQEKRK